MVAISSADRTRQILDSFCPAPFVHAVVQYVSSAAAHLPVRVIGSVVTSKVGDNKHAICNKAEYATVHCLRELSGDMMLDADAKID